MRKLRGQKALCPPINCRLQLPGRAAHETSVDRFGANGLQDFPKSAQNQSCGCAPLSGPKPDHGAREAVRVGLAAALPRRPPSTMEAEPVTSGLAAACRHAGHPTTPLLRLLGSRLLLTHALRAVLAPPHENRRSRETGG